MLLIHVPRLTNRLGYTLNVIFRHMLRTDFEITADKDAFEHHEGPALCYGSQRLDKGLYLRAGSLLFETNIDEQPLRPGQYEGMPTLFALRNPDSDLPFDLLAAVFYTLTRYEEYLPHITDEHGRFPATESVAYKMGFLTTPIVDRWVALLAARLAERYPQFSHNMSGYEVEDSIDIDAAFCYKYKGLFRSLMGMGRDMITSRGKGLLRKRLRVIWGKEEDPFNSFDFILECHKGYPAIQLLFFALMSDYNVYDMPISHLNTQFRELLQHLGDHGKMGLHASHASYDKPSLIATERERLQEILHRTVVRNRFHFLRFRLPHTYNNLLDAGILHDYSMGFSEEAGFRAGTGRAFPFFDLESDMETPLIIHPFAAVDSTFYRYKHATIEESEAAYRNLIDEARAAGTTLSLVWHNQCFSGEAPCEGWRELYQRTLGYANTTLANSPNPQTPTQR